jgi:mannose-6-phosphate isomerase-like protein (cupin superfamily)
MIRTPLVVDNRATRETWFREGCHITEWLNRPADPEASVARARVAPGATTRWHALTGVTERYVVLEGQGLAELGEEPRRVTLRPGDALVIPPGCAQRIHNEGDAPLVFLAICTPRFTPECYQDLETQDGHEIQ